MQSLSYLGASNGGHKTYCPWDNGFKITKNSPQTTAHGPRIVDGSLALGLNLAVNGGQEGTSLLPSPLVQNITR